MTRRLLLTYLSITAFALVIVVVPLGLTFGGRERDRLTFDLERDAQTISARVEEDLEEGRRPALASLFRDYHVDGARILVVDTAGRSVADSSDASLGRDYSTRPEFVKALGGERVTGRRASQTLGVTLVYVAVPVASNGIVHGAVRITLPTSAADDRVRDTWYRLAGLSAVVLIAVGGVGLVLARSVTRPVREVEDAAQRLADGDLEARAGDVGGAPEVAALARQFDATAERLSQLVESQRRFVADASHQLRTPLTALRLRLETLDPSPADEPRVAAALAETDRLARLVQSLLVVARSESAEPVLADVDLAELARERRQVWEPMAEQGQVAVVVEAPEHLVVRGVVGGVEQILDNLLSNSMAVSPPASTITISAVPSEGGGARLVVSDEGPGLTPAQRAQATDRFWRPVDAPKGGSGLGLAIVDALARAGGGDVQLEATTTGSGLRVTVSFGPATGPTTLT